MSNLPELSMPSYEVNLPSNPNIIYKFRPFKVKEEKVLLMVDMSEGSTEAAKVILDLLKACCLNPSFDFTKLSYFDLEFLFLALRARSVGELQTVNYRCTNMVVENPVSGAMIGGDGSLIPNKKECGAMVPVEFDFTKMEIEPAELKNKIDLEEGYTIIMDYPSHDLVLKFQSQMNGQTEPPNMDQLYEYSLTFLSQLLKQIITPNGVVSRGKDFSSEHAREWLEGLSHANFKKIEEFIANLPKVVLKANFVCSKCKYSQEIVMEGLTSFFE